MGEVCWGVWQDRGFLSNPDPIVDLAQTPSVEGYIALRDAECVEDLGRNLSGLIGQRKFRQAAEDLPLVEFSALPPDCSNDRTLERLILLYSYFANAFVFEDPDSPSSYLPEQIACPLYQLARAAGRPPVLSYPSYILSNWRRVDEQGPLELGNLQLLQEMQGDTDEAWFILIHVEIEAIAARVLQGIRNSLIDRDEGDHKALTEELVSIAQGIRDMAGTLARMPEGCDSYKYYHVIRPYIDGFNDVVYRGVSEYAGRPQSFRGQAAAQSSTVPAIVTFLGIAHEITGMTQHLAAMRDYMPVSHRDFLRSLANSDVRRFVSESSDAALKAAYNECIEALLKFRRLHLKTVRMYIFEHSGDVSQLGTGGTRYLQWLRQLADETNMHFLR